VLILAKNPTIYEFFNDLLGGYAYRFAEKQNLSDYCLPLEFGGFYSEQNPAKQHFRELGNASFDSNNQQTIISLNQVYLFNALMETISHELAHYFQLLKHGKSSCESDLVLNNGNYNGELAKEHEKFTQEIYGMIKNSGEYSELESR